MGNADAMIIVRDLWFSYGRNPILSGISFAVPKWSLCGFLGPNGSGKTTLFKCCLKFLRSSRGTIIMDGRHVSTLSVSDMAKITSYVPQDHAPPFPFLVEDIVLMGRSPHLKGVFGVSRKDRTCAANALETVGMSALAQVPYSHLSGGQRQLVLMARAITQATPIMFLDEPTAALDFSNQLRVWRLMREISEDGVTILACSHDPNHVSWFCDDVVVMGNNRILASGSPDTVITDSTLESLYDESCILSRKNGIPLVLPSSVPNCKDRDYSGS